MLWMGVRFGIGIRVRGYHRANRGALLGLLHQLLDGGAPVPTNATLGHVARVVQPLLMGMSATQHIAGQESFLLADDANRCKRMPHLDRHF